VYDRQEVIELLVLLQAVELAEPRFGVRIAPRPFVLLEEYDENIFWFIGNGKHWYQV
jgi:hypothetical protein